MHSRVNGAPPTRNGFCGLTGNATREIARVTFNDCSKGYDFDVATPCSTSDFGFTTQLATWTWDVYVSRGSWADESGVNLLAGSYQALLRVAVP